MFRNQRVVGLSCLAILALGIVPVSAAPPTAEAAKIKQTERTFDSGGKKIHVDHFEPAAACPCPAIILLHGVDGAEADKGLFHSVARRFAARGYHIFYVHYFDRTGGGKEARELFKKCLDGTASKEQMTLCQARFREWKAAVCDAVTYVRKRPGVDGRLVGLVGISLGAYLATSVAADESTRVGAVVEFFGGLPQEARRDLQSLPPVLGFHGDADQTVPVKEAEDLRDLLTTKGLTGEVHIYKGVGHVFQKDGRLRWDMALDAERRTAAFLDKHLRRDAVAERRK